MSVEEVVEHLRRSDPAEAATWLQAAAGDRDGLDRREGGSAPKLVSYHADELRRVERGYGVSESGQALRPPGGLSGQL
jgi:type I restriction enzyme R subunit